MDFGEALARLFVQAGRPTLRASATRARVSAQRISDWRNGRHLPRDFATVEPLLVWLTARAVAAGADDVLTIRQWREMWDHRTPDEARAEEPSVPQQARPFAGLATLTAADSQMYFGRDDVVGTLVDAILAARKGPPPLPPASRLVVVTGVSGSGKSSLLRAGLARDARLAPPRLGEITPGGLAIADPAEAEATDAPAPPPPTTIEQAVIVIDQFENVFSLEDSLRAETLREVEELAHDTVVVVGVRADFFSQCVEHPFLADAWQHRCVIVSEMTRTQLREVITAPVRLAGGRIETGLADVMITELYEASTGGDRAGRLPLLAHVLQATWARRSGNRMTLSGYRATGGIARAVADTAEAAWAAIDPRHRDLARAVLLALVHVGPAGIALRVPLSTPTLANRFPPEVATVIDEFAQARLLTVSTDSVMLVHDVVLTAWPRLAEWIADDTDNHLWRQQVDADSAAWMANGRGRSFLYTGSRLDDAKRRRRTLRSDYLHLLSKENDAFLDAAVAMQQRRRLTRIGAVSVIVVLAIAATITAAIGFRQAHDLRQQRNAAERSALLSHIDSMQFSNPSLAARLLLVAHRIYPDDPTVESRLRGAATTPLVTPLTGHTGPVYDLSFDRTGTRLASASGDRTVRVWTRSGSSDYRESAVLRGFGNYVTSTDFHPTRQLLASSSGDGSVRMWDLTDASNPRAATTVSPGHGTVYMVRFSADGRTLAASSDDGTITVYAVSPTGSIRETAVLRGHTAAARTLSFSPDGRTLASGGDDRTVRLWTTGESPQPLGPPLTGFPSITHAVAFSPDSRSLAVTGDSPNAQLWDVADPLAPRPLSTSLPNSTAGSWSIAFDSSGSQLASARADGLVRVWNTANPTSPTLQWALQTTSEQGSVRTFSARFDPSGDQLVSGRSDGTIDVWSLPGRTEPDRGGTITGLDTDAAQRVLATVGSDTTLNLWTTSGGLTLRSRTPIQRRVNDHPRVSLNGPGTLAATANNNGGLVELWDITDTAAPRRAAALGVATRYSFPVVFAPSGNLLATGDTDTTVALWDTSDPRSPRRVGAPLRGPTDLIRNVAFSPDGTRLALTSDDKRVYLYDLTSSSPDPVDVITDEAPIAQAAFDDGGVLVVASRDLSTWRLPPVGSDAEPELLDRQEDMFASTVSMAPNRLAVGTATHELISFALNDDGQLTDRQPVGTLLATTDTTTTWQLPVQLPSDEEIISGGDTTGNVYLHTLDLDVARDWICASTAPLTDAQRDAYLPHVDVRANCGRD
ncbi:putative NTPase, NACHT family protein [Gordonia terrae C-6]|uniref:Putative NTPase, NACHT family protein n=1 Tax=Gordonia terrae C-6 TaxID=1316928 RepID=R7Y8Z5_9ACTN|nr:NTPase NACHT family protein [Gordonia terrae]EON32475.1 putative NTPase, NACHT family protein [Gordonia terrae C-6]